MTQWRNVARDEAPRTDAELARRWAAGDQEAFAEVYRRHADALYATAVGLLGGDRAAAADALQDTLVRATTRIGQLRDPDRLRAWLFAILRNEVTNRHRHTARLTQDEELTTMAAEVADPTTGLHRAELIGLVWTAAESLQERDREVVELHLRGGLDGSELADALGVSASHGYVLVSRMKDRMERAVGALLVARVARKDCPELDRRLAGWDGRFSMEIRSKVTRHVESCDTCTRRRKALVAFDQLVAGAVPVVVAPAGLFEAIQGRVATGSEPPQDWSWRADGFPEPTGPVAPEEGSTAGGTGRRIGVRALVVAAVATAVLAGGGVVLARAGRGDVEVATGVAAVASSPSGSPTGSGPTATSSATASTSAVPTAPTTSSTMPPPTSTSAATSSSTSTSTSTSASTSTSSPTSTSTSTSTPGGSAVPPGGSVTTAGRGRLTVDRTVVDLGATERAARVVVRNDGAVAVVWSAAVSGPGFAVSPAEGTLAVGAAVTLTASVDRTGRTEGDLAGRIDLVADGELPPAIALSARVEVAPVIVRFALTPSTVRTPGGPTCVPIVATATAAATDDSGIASVEATWATPSGPVTVPMTSDGRLYQAPVGPFATPGPATVTVTVTDTRGNRAERTATVQVVRCA